jgi:hypothetical protein
MLAALTVAVAVGGGATGEPDALADPVHAAPPASPKVAPLPSATIPKPLVASPNNSLAALKIVAGEFPVPPGSTVKTTCRNSMVHVSICTDPTHCREVLAAPCAPLGCDAKKTWCSPYCASDADCSAGSSCNTSNGKCAMMPNQCADPFTIVMGSGQLAPCSPYRCKGGMCQQQCQTDADCSVDFKCLNHIACVAK